MLADTASGGLAAGLATIFFAAAFTDNILLTRYLGMCSFLAVSRQMKTALGLGLAVMVVTACTAGINAALYRHVLLPLEAMGVPATTMQLILFIVVIASFVQLLEMVLERLSPALYFALGIYLPLVTVNCAILGTSLFMVTRDYGVPEGLLYGLGSGAGWMLAIVLMAGIRGRLRPDRVPAGLDGPGLALLISGIMALALTGVSGIIK